MSIPAIGSGSPMHLAHGIITFTEMLLFCCCMLDCKDDPISFKKMYTSWGLSLIGF